MPTMHAMRCEAPGRPLEPGTFALPVPGRGEILIEGYRRAILYGDFLAAPHWAVLAVESLVLFAIGQRIYRYYDRRVIKFL